MPLKTKFYTFCFLFLLKVTVVLGQTSSIQWYTSEDGLPQNSVRDIINDSHGFLWLATPDALCRYDGNAFLQFDDLPIKSKLLKAYYSNEVKDSIFNYEISDQVQARIQKRISVRFASPAPKIKHNNQEYAEIINSASIYYIEKKYNYYYRTKKGNFLVRDNNVWYNSGDNNGFRMINSLSCKYLFESTLLINSIPFYIDKKNKQVWKYTSQGFMAQQADTSIFDQNGKFYWNNITTQSFFVLDKNIYTLDIKNNRLEKKFICAVDGFNDLNIRSIFFDQKYQKVFLASNTKGLGIVSLQNFQVAQSTINPTAAVYYAHIPIDSNSVLTPNGQILKSSGLVKDFNFKRLTDYLSKRHILADLNDSYWVLKDSVLLKYAYSGFNPPILTDSLKLSYTINNLYATGNNFAAAVEIENPHSENSTIQNLLYFYDGKNFKKIKETFRFDIRVTAVCQVSDALYLIGTRKGVFWLDRKTKKKQIIHESKELNVRNISQTAKGTTLITTNGQGLYLVNQKKLIKLPLNQNNALKNAHCILEDQANYLWISTNNGLVKVPEIALVNYANNTDNQIYYYLFTKESGFNVNEFNGSCHPCSNKLANGQFTFSSLDGIVFFKPNEILTHYPTNELLIERYKIDG